MAHSDKRSPITDALETLGMVLTGEEKRDAIHLAVDPVVASCMMRPGEHIGVEDGVAYLYGSATKSGKSAPYHGIVDPFLDRPVEEGQQFWFVMKPREVRSLRHVWAHPDFPDEPEVTKNMADFNQKIEFPSSVTDFRELEKRVENLSSLAKPVPVDDKKSPTGRRIKKEPELHSFPSQPSKGILRSQEGGQDYQTCVEQEDKEAKDAAYQWIVRYAGMLTDMIEHDDWGDNSDINAEELIETAKSHMNSGWGDFIVRGGTFEGYHVSAEFWTQLGIYLGEDLSDYDGTNFFSCSC